MDNGTERAIIAIAEALDTTLIHELVAIQHERNTIEKATLAEMRAARWLHEDHTNHAGGSVWHKGESPCAKAQQEADALTAEALGEVKDV